MHGGRRHAGRVVVVVLLVMRLLMRTFHGGMTRRVIGLLVVVEMRSIMVVFLVGHVCALLKGMEMLKRCQTRWLIVLTM